MRDFTYTVAARLEDAFAADGHDAMPIAGGTELLNWFRLGVVAPGTVIDISRLEGLRGIVRNGDTLRIGALTTLNEIGDALAVNEYAHALAQACKAAASSQIRNRATIGGNVLQKTRCAYFRAEAPLPWPCNKRLPGSGCAARNGANERHAIFGWTDACVAVMPSDPAVALVALRADVDIAGPMGVRALPLESLHLTQAEAAAEGGADQAALLETRLRPGEVITGYRVPLVAERRSAYIKVRERASYEYALVSAAAALSLDEAGRIAKAEIVLGSVAQKPWRLHAAEPELLGLPPTREAILPVMRKSLSDAHPLQNNAYKIPMSAAAATRALVQAGGLR